ncbi:MAG: preQ(1) synthase [Candidatus Omnitrophica bacterium]|nr:preQ(1) synthase [Candidatus Omnitrophota bacterium]
MKKQTKNKSLYENLQKDIRDLKMPEIEVWENMYSDKNYWIEMDVPEFTCICPKTGLPDFATITIEYMPDKSCLELKSFKLYINQYRDVGIFHEHVVNKIMDDLIRACKPRAMSVHGEFNLRGGIKTSVSAEYIKRKK